MLGDGDAQDDARHDRRQRTAREEGRQKPEQHLGRGYNKNIEKCSDLFVI